MASELFERFTASEVGRARELALAGRYPRAAKLLGRMYNLRHKQQGPEHRDTLLLAVEWDTALAAAGLATEAVSVLENTVSGLRSRSGTDDAESKHAEFEHAEFEHAAHLLRETHPLAGVHEYWFGPLREETRGSISSLGSTQWQCWSSYHLVVAHRDAGDLRRAYFLLLDTGLLAAEDHAAHASATAIEHAALAASRRLRDYQRDGGPPLTADDAGAVSFIETQSLSPRDIADPATMCADAVEWYSTHLGPDSTAALAARFRYARALAGQGRRDEAEAEYERVYLRRNATLPDGHPDRFAAAKEIAHVYLGQGRHSEAVAVAKPIVDERRRAFGDRDIHGVHLGLVLVQSLTALRRDDEAQPYLTWLEHEGAIKVERPTLDGKPAR